MANQPSEYSNMRYVDSFANWSLQQLRLEPELLAEKKSHIVNQKRELAFGNYRTFIDTAECSRSVYKEFGTVEEHVQSILDQIPELSEKCRGFGRKAQEIENSRRLTNLSLQKHNQVLEVLEISQLMDTCVRNGYWDEAMELEAHVRRLDKKHGPTIPLISGIATEVRQSSQIMLQQMLQQLQGNIQLPACLRLVGYLRRMDVFTSAELRIVFLHSRDVWLQSVLNSVPTDDAYSHLSKTIEQCRVHLFDIVTQYRAVFSDEDSYFTVRDTAAATDVNRSAIFHSWVNSKIGSFLRTLHSDLSTPLVGGSGLVCSQRLDSLLAQCLYFGLSFSRVGIDFRGLIVPIFTDVVMAEFKRHIEQSLFSFETNLSRMVLYQSSSSSFHTTSSHYAPADASQLPQILLEYPALAAFFNDVIEALNNLRLCCPASLAESVYSNIKQMFTSASVIIANNKTSQDSAQPDSDLLRFCEKYALVLIPHIDKCLQELFPFAAIASQIGLPESSLHKDDCFRLNAAAVTESISDLLPEIPVFVVADLESTASDVHAQAHVDKPIAGGDDTAEKVSDVMTKEVDKLLNLENEENLTNTLDDHGVLTKPDIGVKVSDDLTKNVDKLLSLETEENVAHTSDDHSVLSKPTDIVDKVSDDMMNKFDAELELKDEENVLNMLHVDNDGVLTKPNSGDKVSDDLTKNVGEFENIVSNTCTLGNGSESTNPEANAGVHVPVNISSNNACDNRDAELVKILKQ